MTRSRTCPIRSKHDRIAGDGPSIAIGRYQGDGPCRMIEPQVTGPDGRAFVRETLEPCARGPGPGKSCACKAAGLWASLTLS